MRCYSPLLVGAILTLLYFGYVFGGFDEKACFRETKEIPLNTQWTVLEGCQVEIIQGEWISLEQYQRHYSGKDGKPDIEQYKLMRSMGF